MWLLGNDDLPETAIQSINGLPLAVLGGNKRDNIRLCAVEIPDLITGDLSDITANTAVVTVSNTLAVFEVVYGNNVFTLADSDTPQPGQFTFDRSTQQITLYTSTALPAGIGVVVRGERNTAPAIAQGSGLPPTVSAALPLKIKTNYVDPGLFWVFWGLPVVGAINWGCSFEQQPTGSISLFVPRESIGTVRSRFAKGTQIEFASVGFSVSSYNEKLLNTEEFPGGLYEVSISLTGWYNQYRYLKPVLLKSQFDPDCSLIADGNSITFGNGTATKTSVSDLSSKNGVSVSLSGYIWNVNIPADTAADATTTWQGEMQSRLRVNGAFVSYSSEGVVRAKGINSVSQWNFHVPEFEIAYQGEIKPIHWKVDGQFVKKANKEDEDTQNKKVVSSAEPKWQKREPFIETVTNGDENAATCPDVGGNLTDPSSNYDQSGPTKSLEISVMMDGSPLSRRNVTFGYAYSAHDIYRGEDENETPIYSGAPENYWRIIKDQTENFYYDNKTGYLTGSKIHGWQLVRFKTENFKSGEPAIAPTVEGNAADADEEQVAELEYYKFRRAPINGFSEYYLLQHSDYYKDTEPPSKVQYPVCKKVGVNQWVKDYKEVIDPNWVPSMFVKREQRFVNTFFTIKDPSNQFKEDGEPRNPDPTTGEESYQSRQIHILASANTFMKTFNLFQAQDKTPDRYLEYNKQYSASGSGFNSVAEESKASQQSGRPGIATKRNIVYERVQPEDKDYEFRISSGGENNKSSSKYEFHLLSGKSIASVVDGSVSYPYAETESEAIRNAETEITIQRIQEVGVASATVAFNPNIREFDKVNISTGYDSYMMRVLSFSNSVEIQGQLNGIPLVTSDGTKLSLGLDQTAEFSIQKKSIPQPKLTPASDPNRKGLTLGWISNIVLRNRRRPGTS
jgi:hypothetical protein